MKEFEFESIGIKPIFDYTGDNSSKVKVEFMCYNMTREDIVFLSSYFCNNPIGLEFKLIVKEDKNYEIIS